MAAPIIDTVPTTAYSYDYVDPYLHRDINLGTRDQYLMDRDYDLHRRGKLSKKDYKRMYGKKGPHHHKGGHLGTDPYGYDTYGYGHLVQYPGMMGAPGISRDIGYGGGGYGMPLGGVSRDIGYGMPLGRTYGMPISRDIGYGGYGMPLGGVSRDIGYGMPLGGVSRDIGYGMPLGYGGYDEWGMNRGLYGGGMLGGIERGLERGLGGIERGLERGIGGIERGLGMGGMGGMGLGGMGMGMGGMGMGGMGLGGMGMGMRGGIDESRFLKLPHYERINENPNIDNTTLWRPRSDIFDVDQENLRVEFELPGVPREDISLTIQDNILTLAALKPQTRKEEVGFHYQNERHFGKFYRRLLLPFSVDPNKVRAHMDNGVLKVHLIRLPGAAGGRIPIGEGLLQQTMGTPQTMGTTPVVGTTTPMTSGTSTGVATTRI